MRGNEETEELTFVHDGFEVFHFFELFKGWALPVEGVLDFFSEFGPYVGPACEGEPHVA